MGAFFLFWKVIRMKVADHLNKNTKKQLNQMNKPKLSRRDVEELMGVRRDTYKRNRGAIRRK